MSVKCVPLIVVGLLLLCRWHLIDISFCWWFRKKYFHLCECKLDWFAWSITKKIFLFTS